MSDFEWAFLAGIVVGAGATLGWVAYRFNAFINKLAEEVENKINTIQNNSLMAVEVERGENGVIYCYGEDKQFICQGTNLAEIKKAFAERFPDKTAYLAGGDAEVVEQLTAEVKADTKL